MANPHEPVDPEILFSAERTFLSWLRTGLALMGFGFVVARFGFVMREVEATANTSPTAGWSRWFGVAFVALGVVLSAGAAAQHVITIRRLAAGQTLEAQPTWLGLTLAALLCTVGALMTAYLVTMVK